MQRIIIDVENVEQFEKMRVVDIFTDIINKYHCNNFTIRVPEFYNKSISLELAAELKDANIPFYYNTIVSDFDTLQGFISKGVSDVLIGNSLGFELAAVSLVCKNANVYVRAYPNVAQSTWSDSHAIKCFFVRPEAALPYDEFIDVYEFYQNDNSRTNPDVLYEVYAQIGKWAGNLDELIMYFDKPLDSRSLMPEFDIIRTRCGKKCYKGSGCRICDNALELALTMRENDLFIKQGV